MILFRLDIGEGATGRGVGEGVARPDIGEAAGKRGGGRMAGEKVRYRAHSAGIM